MYESIGTTVSITCIYCEDMYANRGCFGKGFCVEKIAEYWWVVINILEKENNEKLDSI